MYSSYNQYIIVYYQYLKYICNYLAEMAIIQFFCK